MEPERSLWGATWTPFPPARRERETGAWRSDPGFGSWPKTELIPPDGPAWRVASRYLLRWRLRQVGQAFPWPVLSLFCSGVPWALLRGTVNTADLPGTEVWCPHLRAPKSPRPWIPWTPTVFLQLDQTVPKPSSPVLPRECPVNSGARAIKV